MNANEFREKINAATRMITDTVPKAETEADAQMATLMGIGIEIIGEFLMDVKRIADAREKDALYEWVQPHPPEREG